MNRLEKVFVACVVLAPCVAAQRTWVVDWRQGPGTNFTDLPPAVAAAQAGDTVLVRGGTYSPATINKGITVLAPWGYFFRVAGAFVVRDVPANERCVIKTLVGSLVPGDLVLENNQGSIHIEDFTPILSFGGDMQIRNCQHVTLERSGMHTVVIDSSNVLFTDCGISPAVAPSPFAVSATNSKVVFANCTVQGTSGTVQPIGCTVLLPPQPALLTTNSDILLAGGTRVNGGVTGSGYLCTGPTATGIIANGGTLTYDDSAGPQFNRLRGTIQTIIHSTPVVTAKSDWPGGILDLWMFGPANGVAALLASLPRRGPPVYLGPAPGWPGLWIDDLAFLVVSIETFPANRIVQRQMPHFIPPQLYNLPVTFQAVVAAPSGGLELSTASCAILN